MYGKYKEPEHTRTKENEACLYCWILCLSPQYCILHFLLSEVTAILSFISITLLTFKKLFASYECFPKNYVLHVSRIYKNVSYSDISLTSYFWNVTLCLIIVFTIPQFHTPFKCYCWWTFEILQYFLVKAMLLWLCLYMSLGAHVQQFV